jgi:hypothetical protein
MHVVRTALFILIAVTALACKSPTPHESVDFDTSVDFSGPQKLAFLEDTKPRVDSTPERTLVRDAIERELSAAGHRFVGREQADFLISYRVGAYAKVRDSGTITGEGGQEGILMIAFRDSKTEHTVWYGRGDKTVGEATNAKREIDRITHSLLSRFPPPPGSIPDDLN